MLFNSFRRNFARLMLESLESRFVPANIFWGVDANGLWDVASNWVDEQGSHRVPGFNDDVFLDRGTGPITITHAQNNDTIFSLRATSSALVLSGGTITTRSSSELDGSLILSGGTLAPQGPLTLNGDIQWTAGRIDGAGPTINNNVITLSGPNSKLLSGNLTNNGTIIVTETGDLNINGSGVLNNQFSSLVDLESDAGITGQGTSVGQLSNLGTVLKSAGTGTSHIPALSNQGGTLDVESGIMQLGGAGKSNMGGGTFIAGAGAILDLATGSNDGTYMGTYTGSGDGTVRLSRGRIEAVGDSGVTLNFPGQLFQWTGGEIYASIFGTLVTNTGTINVDGPAPKSANANLFNDGTINLGGTGDFVIPTFTTLTNQPDGFFNWEFDASVFGGGSFNNTGYLLKAGGSGNAVWEPSYTNAGTLEIDTGTLGFNHDVTQTNGTILLTGGALIVPNLNIQGGVLSGWGLIIGNVTNGGELDIGDSQTASGITITGNYTQTQTGVLNIKLGAIEQAEYDQLQVGGRATLNGRLNVTLLDSFYAQSGDSAQIMTFGSRSGDFAVYNLPDISPLTFVPSLDNTSLTLSVV
jgi:hypothetical protein